MEESTPSGKDYWDKEDCRVRYVQDPRPIGLRDLGNISGHPYVTLSKWCKTEGWVTQRQEFHTIAQRECDRVACEKAVEVNSNALIERSQEHLEGAEFFGYAALEIAELLVDDWKKLSTDKAFKMATRSQFYMALRTYSQIYYESVNVQRDITGMAYLDLNKAMEAVMKAGYDVSDRITKPPTD